MRATTPAVEEILDRYFPCLDHGFVSLVDYMGDDTAIIDAARTSYGAGTRRVSEDRALGRYLYRQRHTGPYEMVELKFHCKMPIFVARQWIRHRTANVNEYSGRYSLMPMQFYTPNHAQVTTQSKSNKQGRSDNLLQIEEYERFVSDLSMGRSVAKSNYEEHIKSLDIAREVARIDLPLSLYTEWYWKIDLHNLLHFLGLRCDSHAQWEIREYADVMAGMVKRATPNAFEAWLDYHPNIGGKLLSRQEIKLLRTVMGIYTSEWSGSIMLQQSGKITPEEMKKAGLSRREIEAFQKVFSEDVPQGREAEEFELDLSRTKTAEFFKAETAKYTPRISG